MHNSHLSSESFRKILIFLQTPNLDEQIIFDKIVDEAAQLMEADRSELFVLDESGERIKLQATTDNFLKRKMIENTTAPYARGEGLTGWIFKTGKALCINNISHFKKEIILSNSELEEISDGTNINDEDMKLKWLDKDGQDKNSPRKFFCGVPIKTQYDEVIGVLRISSGKEQVLKKSVIKPLQDLSTMVSAILYNERQKRLKDMLIKLGTKYEKDKLFDFVVKETPKLILGKGCSIFLVDEEDEKLKLEYTNSPYLENMTVTTTPTKENVLSYKIGESKTGLVGKLKKTMIINYYGIGRVGQQKLNIDYHNWLNDKNNMVKILFNENKESIGLLRLHRDENEFEFTIDDNKALDAFLDNKSFFDLMGTITEHVCETGKENPAISFLAIPIKDIEKKKLLGVLRIPRTFEGSFFTDADVAFIESIINRLTIILEKERTALTKIQLQRFYEEIIKVLSEVSNDLVGPYVMSLEHFYTNITTKCMKIFNAQAGSLYLEQIETDSLGQKIINMVAGVGYEKNRIGKAPYTRGQGLTGSVWKDGKSFKFDSADKLRNSAESPWAGCHDSVIKEKDPSWICSSIIAVPLRVGDKVIGVLKIENKNPGPPSHFTNEELQILEIMASYIALAIEVKRINSVAFKKGESARIFLHSAGTPIGSIEFNLSHALRAGLAHTNSIRYIKTAHETAYKLLNDFNGIKQEDTKKLFVNVKNLLDWRKEAFIKELEYNTEPEQGKVQLNTDLPHNNFLIYVNPEQFIRALDNLILNAIQSVREMDTEHRKILLHVKPISKSDDQVIEIYIADMGPGLSEELHSRFNSQKNLPSTKKGGSGIGLSEANSCIKSNNGELTHMEPVGQIFESRSGDFSFKYELGSGCIFKIVFNAYKLPEKIRVLVIDDDPSYLDTFMNITADLSILEITSKLSPDILIQNDINEINENFDLIFMDCVYSLPYAGPSGLEIFKNLKNTILSPKIILISIYDKDGPHVSYGVLNKFKILEDIENFLYERLSKLFK